MVRGNRGYRGSCEICPERVETSVGDVEDFQYAEYQRQPQGNDEQPGCLNKPIENYCEKQVHGILLRLPVSIARKGRWRQRTHLGANTGRRREQSSRHLHPCAGRGGDSVQLHLAPCMPALIHSIDFTPAGGLTHSAGKYWISTRSTRLVSGLYLVRLKAIGWIA